MARIKNIESYIENKIQKELNKSIIGLVDKRIRQLSINRMSNRHQGNIINDFGRNAVNASIKHLMSFRVSNSQFMNTFAEEMKRALIRSI